MPTGFVPDQDKGYLIVTAQLPDSASLERTAGGHEADGRDRPATTDAGRRATRVGIAGQSFLLNANGSNFASMFVILKPFDERHGGGAWRPMPIAAVLRRQFMREDRGRPGRRLRRPAGRRPGQRRRLQDDGQGHRRRGPADVLQEQADNLAAAANQQPGLVGVFSMFRANTPQLYVDVDRDEVQDDWACR